MENKKEHIDEALFKCLNGFEHPAPGGAKAQLMDFLEHLSHPIDFSLNKHLSESGGSLPITTFEQLAEQDNLSSNTLDLTLHQHLSVLEQNAPELGEYPTEKRKRKLLPVFALMFLAAIALSYNIYRSRFAEKPSKDNLNSINNQTTELTNNSLENGWKKTSGIAIEKPSKEEKETPTPIAGKQDRAKRHIREIHVSENHDESSQNHPEGIITGNDEYKESEDSEGYMTLRNGSFPSEDKEDQRTVELVKRKKLISPVSLVLWFVTGYEHNRSSIDDVNLHKDAEKLYNQGLGLQRKNTGFNLGLRTRISKKFNVTAGVSYNHIVNHSEFVYVFSEAPVYDAQGRLKGYVGVPPREIRNTIGSSSTEIRTPISVQYNFIQTTRHSFGVGITGDAGIFSKTRLPVFNFSDARFSESGTKARHSYGYGINLNSEYKLNAYWALGCQINFNLRKSVMDYLGHVVYNQRTESTLKIGLIYTPGITFKKKK